MPICKTLPPYLEDVLFLLCPGDQLLLRAVTVAAMVQVFCLSSLAAVTVRNAAQDLQKSSQSPLFICSSPACHGSMVFSHQMPETWPLFKSTIQRRKGYLIYH